MVMLRKSTLLPLVLASVIGLTGAVECPATDKKGGTLKGTDVDTDFAVCEYTIAGRCEYFASNGSFSSGSSSCPVGEPQPGGVATPDNAEQQGGQNAPVQTLPTIPSLPTIVQTQNVPVATLPSPVQPQVATTQVALPTIPAVNAPAPVLSVPPIAIPSVLPTLSLPGVELPSVSIPSIPIPSLPPVQIPSALSLPPVQLPSVIPPVQSLPAAVTSLLPSIPQVSPPAVPVPGVPLNDPNVAQVTSFSTVFVKPTGLSDVAPPTSYPSSATAAQCGSVLFGAAVSVLVGFMLI